MKIGDVSRPRRWADAARQRWYAFHRSVRFANRMLGVSLSLQAVRIPVTEMTPAGLERHTR
jgi:hypothetical protein